MAFAGQIKIAPLAASFGAVVSGVKLSSIGNEDWRVIYQNWLLYGLLIFPEQHLTREQQINFAKRFGPLEFDLVAISNVRRDGSTRTDVAHDETLKILRGNMDWHADSTYMPVQAKGAVFSADVVPKTGGQTGFVDMRAAYDALDVETRERANTLSAYHSLHYSQSKVNPVASQAKSEKTPGYGFHDGPVPLRPLVKIHPETGRKSLAIGRHAHNIPTMSEKESEDFLQRLLDFSCQAPRTYFHDWKQGETVIWDNRCLLHCATPWDLSEPRIMWHTRLAGDPVSEAALQSG